MSTQDQLEWEARNRPKAGVAAILGALLTFGSNLISGLTLTDAPGVSLIAALQSAAEEGPVAEAISLRVATYEYLQDHATQLLLGALVNAIGFLAIAYALTYLARAVRARREEFPRPAVYLGAFGGIAYALFAVLAQIAQGMAISDFLDGSRTVEEAQDIGGGGLLVFAQILYIPAVLALGLAFVFISLNAMRAGLLTRFMGVLGIMLGVFLVLPILPYGATLIQVFWLGALGLILLERGPGGLPPAWHSGQAEPWPSTRQIREARAPRPPASAPDDVAEEPAAPRVQHPSSKKRKRKRRT